MRRRLLIVSLIVLFGTVWSTTVGWGGQPRSKKRKAPNSPVAAEPEFLPKLPIPGLADPPRERPVQNPRSLPSRVETHPRARGDMLKLHTEAAKLINLHTEAAKLNNLPQPALDERLHRFRWVGDDPKCLLTGWGGFIETVEPVEGGFLVSVRVSPTFTVSGGSAVTADYIIERYSIIDGHVQFVQAIHPPDAVRGVELTD
jgi:hypothetical protein